MNLIDSVVSTRNYVAVVVVRESGCDVGMAGTVGMHGFPMDCNASQLVNFKSFCDSKPTPHLRLGDARAL